jgi:hypothetical protein
MKKSLCILALLVFSADSADAYVRRTVGGGYVARGAGVYGGRYAGGFYGRSYFGHPVARGAAIAAGAAVGATAWGWNQHYYGDAYAADYGDDGYANHSYVTGRPTLYPRYYGGYDGGYAASGYPGYSGGGFAYRSYITGRPTLLPRHYGGSDPYGSYAAIGYSGDDGGYVNRSYVTGRPTLIPRYYNGY